MLEQGNLQEVNSRRLAYLQEKEIQETGSGSRDRLDQHFYGITGYYEMTTEELLKDYRTFLTEEFPESDTDWIDAESFYADWAKNHEDEPQVFFLVMVIYEVQLRGGRQEFTAIAPKNGMFNLLSAAQTASQDYRYLSLNTSSAFSQDQILRAEILRVSPIKGL
jgi:hypothetical protein